MATIKGDRQLIKPGLYLITRETSAGKALAFYNETPDTQFIISYTFDGEVKQLGRTQPAPGVPGKFAVTVYPTETQEFVEGSWRSFKRSLSFGPPEKSWMEKQALAQDNKTLAEIDAVKELVKKNPRSDGKYTSDYIAQLCIDNKVPFVDLAFLPRSQSLAREWEPPLGAEFGSISWHRPQAWCSGSSPALFVGSIEPNDIDQGILGDCYLMSSLACLAEFPSLIREVFSAPQHPEFGVYRVILCKNGWWQTVVVDDFIPTQRGKPCFARNREEPNELWVSLLEKAYAKLHGSYAAIKSGDPAHAIADVIGAPFVKLAAMREWQDKTKMFNILKAADERGDLMTLSTPSKLSVPVAALSALTSTYEGLGLSVDHAYSLLQVKEVLGNKLCNIRNPWGNEKEWNGAWSDDSPLWTSAMKTALNFTKADDGAFWMAWEDVVKYFTTGSLSYPLRSWSQLRVSGNMDEGTPDLIISLTVKESVEVFAGCHQRDPRGLPSGDRDLTYCGLLLTILGAPASTGAPCEMIAQTNDAYTSSRDSYVRVRLAPRSAPYIIITQVFEAVSKSFTMSLLISEPSAVERLVFLAPTNALPKGQRRQYIPATKFVISDWNRRAVANFQVRSPRRNGEGFVLQTVTADEVEHSLLTESTTTQTNLPIASTIVPTRGPMPNSSGIGAAPRHTDPAAGKIEDVPQVQPISKLVGTGAIKLQVLVLSGRNLVPKDLNGLSDPYVTIKLKTQTGERLAVDQRQATRFIADTLNPCWCESFQFNANSSDVLCIKVWDKDTTGHDAMGIISLPVSDALKGMSAGGQARVDWLALSPPPSDARGELQLGFSWLL